MANLLRQVLRLRRIRDHPDGEAVHIHDALTRYRPQRVVFLSSIASHIFGERYAEQKLIP